MKCCFEHGSRKPVAEPSGGCEPVTDEQIPRRVEPSWVSEGASAHDLTLVENWLIRLRRERFRSRKSGRIHDYYVAQTPDAVHVVAITPDQKVVMVRQFRAGSRSDELETPGGLLEQNEDACAAGARELLEETGYAGDPPQFLGPLWPNPGLLTTRIMTVVIRNAQQIADPQPDPTEELTIELIQAREIPKLIRTGHIAHAACVAGLLWWIYLEDPDQVNPGCQKHNQSDRPDRSEQSDRSSNF